MTPEEIKAGFKFPANGGKPELTAAQQAAMREYLQVRGHPQKEQAAVLKLHALGLTRGIDRG